MYQTCHKVRTSFACCVRKLKFISREDGNASIETVIWLPIFGLLLGLIMNVSMLFFNESQILRFVQDANRAFSLGRFEKPEEVESYILNKLAYLEAAISIETVVSGGSVSTRLSAPATDIMPFTFLSSVFQGVTIGVSAQHFIEY